MQCLCGFNLFSFFALFEGSAIYGALNIFIQSITIYWGRSLSREDIKAVLEYGCLNTNRKVVDSGKRLRAFVNLDEGFVSLISAICKVFVYE